jgi:hypothetical protein
MMRGVNIDRKPCGRAPITSTQAACGRRAAQLHRRRRSVQHILITGIVVTESTIPKANRAGFGCHGNIAYCYCGRRLRSWRRHEGRGSGSVGGVDAQPRRIPCREVQWRHLWSDSLGRCRCRGGSTGRCGGGGSRSGSLLRRRWRRLIREFRCWNLIRDLHNSANIQFIVVVRVKVVRLLATQRRRTVAEPGTWSVLFVFLCLVLFVFVFLVLQSSGTESLDIFCRPIARTIKCR